MSRFRSPYLIAALAAVVALVAGVLALSGGGKEPGAAEAGPAPTPLTSSDDPFAKGSADAPVVMVAYSDFQCPFCGQLARETEPQLDRYIEDGTLRVEWRDFPYMGSESTAAAVAARAAAEQDKFWEYHEALYALQPPRPNRGGMDAEMLRTAAENAGLDVEQWADDRARPDPVEDARADFDEGVGKGVTGTPTFFINDRPLVGAQPLEVFERAIEEAAGR